MRSDLASLFHLLSAISFMKSTWPPCCILIKNSFCAALKKVGALFPILGDDGGTAEGAGAICLLSPVSGTEVVSTSRSHSFTAVMTSGCRLGQPVLPPTKALWGLCLKSMWTWGQEGERQQQPGMERQAPALGTTCREGVGMALKAFSESLLSGKRFEVTAPFPAGSSVSGLFDLQSGHDYFAVICTVRPADTSLAPSAQRESKPSRVPPTPAPHPQPIDARAGLGTTPGGGEGGARLESQRAGAARRPRGGDTRLTLVG